MKEVVLPSNRKLGITVGTFEESKALFTAVTEEFRGIKMDPSAEVDVNLFKDLFCTGLSSKKVDTALAALLRRCTYEGLKIDANTFEPVEAREDYLEVIFNVAQENISPFTKSLYARFAEVFQKMKSFQA